MPSKSKYNPRPQPREYYTNRKFDPVRAMYDSGSLQFTTAFEIDDAEQLDADNLRHDINQQINLLQSKEHLVYDKYPKELERLSKKLHHLDRLMTVVQKRQLRILADIAKTTDKKPLLHDYYQYILSGVITKLQKLEDEKLKVEDEYSQIENEKQRLEVFLRTKGLQQRKELDQQLHVLDVVRAMSLRNL